MKGAGRIWLAYVAGPPKQPLDSFEVAQHAEQVRLLLIQFGLTPEGATHWAGKVPARLGKAGGRLRQMNASKMRRATPKSRPLTPDIIEFVTEPQLLGLSISPGRRCCAASTACR